MLLTRTGYALSLPFIRALFNGSLPLMDKTEARYGEIARLMAETGEWVVLQIDYGMCLFGQSRHCPHGLQRSPLVCLERMNFLCVSPTCSLVLCWFFNAGRYRPNKEMSILSPRLGSCFLYLSFSCMLE